MAKRLCSTPKSALSVVEQIESTTKLIAASLGVDTFENYMATAQQSIDATRDAYSQNHRELTEAIATVREHALEEQKKILRTTWHYKYRAH